MEAACEGCLDDCGDLGLRVYDGFEVVAGKVW
jgi:hypothetical protein